MAYGAVDRQTWNDERFRSWDRDVRDVWLYLLTSPHGNRLGCFVLSPYYVADDVQISPDRARECLEFLDRERRVVWDSENRVVCIVRHLHPDYNPLANQNVVKAAVKELKALPSSERALGALFWAVEKWGRPHYEELSEALENRLPNGSREIREAVEEPFPEFTRVTPDPDPDPDPDQEPERRDGGSLPDGRSPPSEPDVGTPPEDENGNRESAFQKHRGRFAGAIRESLYPDNGQPPDIQVQGRAWSTGRDLSICKQWVLSGYRPDKVEAAIRGYGDMVDKGHEAVEFASYARRTLLPLNDKEQQGIPLIETCASWWYKHGPVRGEIGNGVKAS